MTELPWSADDQTIASAPGDLPGEEVARRHAALKREFRHDNTISPLAPRPGEDVQIMASSGTAMNITGAHVAYTTDGSVPGPRSDQVPMFKGDVGWTPFGEYVREWTAVIPGQADGTTVRYRLVGTSADGRVHHAQDGQGFWFRYPPDLSVTTFAYQVAARRPEPEWLRDAVIYQIFVDRYRRHSGEFLNTDDLQAKHGGDLLGIVDSLPYLQELGVTCLWLSPIGPAPSYHRYDSTDLFAVDPLVGDESHLRTLTSEARARGIRVILDFVPSHVSSSHKAFIAATESRDAATADWFVFYDWPSRYRTFLEMRTSLASLNTNSAAARKHLVDSALHWIDCGVSGFRLDHVIGHGMDFWVEFRRAMETADPDIVTIGEATDTGDALRRYSGRLSSILDFPLARALRLVFATGQWSLGDLDGFLDSYESFMESAPIRVSFYDNHDMDRFLHVANGDRVALKLATLCLLTLPHTPVIYYGTEVGATHHKPTRDRAAGGDALARRDMEWSGHTWDRDLLDFFRSVISLRHEHPALRRGERQRCFLDSGKDVYAYSLRAGEDVLVAAFNLSRSRCTVPLPSPARSVLSVGEGTAVGNGVLETGPRSGCLLVLEP